jgi:hypothetical protein
LAGAVFIIKTGPLIIKNPDILSKHEYSVKNTKGGYRLIGPVPPLICPQPPQQHKNILLGPSHTTL